MKAEEQIFSLMAIAEEQQRLVTQSIEHQEKATQVLIGQQQRYLKELQEKQDEVQKEFALQVRDLNQKLSLKINWSKIFLTLLIWFVLAGMTAAGFTVYLRDVRSELEGTRAVLRELQGYNADLSTCTREGVRYPCVRVMRSWGGYGEYEDYFILDPK